MCCDLNQNHIGHLPTLISLFSAFPFKKLGIHLSWMAKKLFTEGFALPEFTESSKFFLHREKNSFTFLKMFPSESLMEVQYLIVLHASGEWFCKILCLPINSRNPTVTDDRTLPRIVLWSSFLDYLGIPGSRIRWWPVLQQGLKRNFLCSDNFFNSLVPPRCYFLTTRRHSEPISSTAFNSWWNYRLSEQRPLFHLNVLKKFCKLLELCCWAGFLTYLSARASHLIL